jgi:hypothetical protein
LRWQPVRGRHKKHSRIDLKQHNRVLYESRCLRHSRSLHVRKPPAEKLDRTWFQNVDFGLLKVIPIHEQRRVEIRGEFVNFFNHLNFGFPVSTLGSARFGHITSTSTPPEEHSVSGENLFLETSEDEKDEQLRRWSPSTGLPSHAFVIEGPRCQTRLRSPKCVAQSVVPISARRVQRLLNC